MSSSKRAVFPLRNGVKNYFIEKACVIFPSLAQIILFFMYVDILPSVNKCLSHASHGHGLCRVHNILILLPASRSIFLLHLNFYFLLSFICFLTSRIPRWFLRCCLFSLFFPQSLEFGSLTNKCIFETHLISSWSIKSINWLSRELCIFVLKTFDCRL